MESSYGDTPANARVLPFRANPAIIGDSRKPSFDISLAGSST